jgi:heterodisulfide reductase subunit C
VAGKKGIVQAELEKLTGLAEKCLQCGLCSAICPPTRFSRKGFHVRRFSLKILRGKTQRKPVRLDEMWSCFLCYDCLKLCPHNINIPDAVVRLRRSSAYEGSAEEAYEKARLYLENMLRYGRIISVAKTHLRKLLNLPEDPRMPEEDLNRFRTLAEATGFKEEVETLKTIYREDAARR